MALKENVKLLRQLLSELRLSSSTGKIGDSLIVRYVLGQFGRYKVTDQQLCKAQDEMKYMCESYVCYLRSGKKRDEIREAYQGKGERSIKETADMVGFKLPHDPK